MLELPKRWDSLLTKTEVLYTNEELAKFKDVWAISNATISANFRPEYNYDERVCDAMSAIYLFYTDQGEVSTNKKNTFLTRVSKKIAEKIAFDLGLRITCYRRIKANIIFNDKDFTPDKFNVPHKDFEDGKCISIIYYVNESDGDTCVFTEYDKESGKLNDPIRFEPIMGSAIALKSNMYHASSNPTKYNKRVVINIVFEYEEI